MENNQLNFQNKLKTSVWVSMAAKKNLRIISKYLDKTKQIESRPSDLSITIFNDTYCLKQRQVNAINNFLINRKNRIKYKKTLSKKINPQQFTLFAILHNKIKKTKIEKFLLYFNFDLNMVCDILNNIFITQTVFLKTELAMTIIMQLLENTPLEKIQDNPYTIELNLLNILTMQKNKKKSLFDWNLQLVRHQQHLQQAGIIFLSYLLTSNIIRQQTNKYEKNGKIILKNTIEVVDCEENILYQKKYAAIKQYKNFEFSWNPAFKVKIIKTNHTVLQQKYMINHVYLLNMYQILEFKNIEAFRVFYPILAAELHLYDIYLQELILTFFFNPKVSLMKTILIINDTYKEQEKKNKIKKLIYRLNTKREQLLTLFSEAYLYSGFEYIFLPFLYDLRGRLYMLSCFTISTVDFLRNAIVFYEKQKKSNNLVCMDAISSNLQCLYLITKSKTIGTKLFVENSDIYDDLVKKGLILFTSLKEKKYYHCANKKGVISEIPFLFDSSTYLPFMQRKIIKRVIMLSAYNAGVSLIANELISQCLIDIDKIILKKLIIFTFKIFNLLYPEMSFLKKILTYLANQNGQVILKTTQINVIFNPKIYKYKYYTQYTAKGKPKRAKYLSISDKNNLKQLKKSCIANTLQSLDAELNFNLLLNLTIPVKALHDGYYINIEDKETFQLIATKNLNNLSKNNYLTPFVKQIKYKNKKKLKKDLLTIITAYDFETIQNTEHFNFSFAYKQENIF